MPVTDMPMRAAFLLQEQSAELGWNHEYNTRPLTGTGVFAFLPLCRASGGALDD